MLEDGAETEVEPVPETYPVRNTWFSKWVDFKSLKTVEIIVALFTKRNFGPFYHIRCYLCSWTKKSRDA